MCCCAAAPPARFAKKLFINFYIQFDCFCLFLTEYSGFKNPNPQVSVLPPTSLTKISKIGHVNVTYRKVIKSKVSYSFGDRMCFCAAIRKKDIILLVRSLASLLSVRCRTDIGNTDISCLD